ncbi:MAG: tRNA 2-methylthio-N6-isopentenyl adenosine(37) hydroxylase MiaE [Bacteroidetes bacterium]|nr:MAG: tRNA 2-methylthio-N6-isopentenyl adenosine(37) hydroxylase MiaE [Bacteroidota bacterium]
MLHLKLETDPRWATIAEENIEEILTDHAWCEQKAATNAITIITHNSQYEDLVTELLELAKEELEHFQMVHNIIKNRGYKLGRERKDSYVNELYKFMNKGGNRNRLESMIDRLLFSAMIEARSCERFKLLSQRIKDPELANFYNDLMISEAGHYTIFITFARKYGKDIDVDKRWKELVEFEGELIKSYGKSESIHG